MTRQYNTQQEIGKTMSDKKVTVSLANTPVRRALARARRSTLLLLFAVGLIAGFVYKAYFADKPAPGNPATITRQR